MYANADSVRLVSGERIGGGLAADGRGELSKLLLGDHPAKALRLARDTGVLAALLPEFEAAIGYDQESRWHGLPLDEHLFATAQAAADAGMPLSVRLAGLLHDLGKPAAAWRAPDGRVHYYAKPGYAERGHEEIGAELAGRIMSRLRYPNRLRRRVRDIVAHHMVDVGRGGPVRARRFLARHGDELGLDLLRHREADFRAKHPPGHAPPAEDLERLTAFRRIVEQERSSPHRLRDLAVDGSDLIEAGFSPGPELGRALAALLDEVVGNPALNTRERLLHRAQQLLAGQR
jgi:putative nucleotidyltransferase with HDIG domain